ncbi:MAG: hypothetical protein Q4C70_01475 [Planctomycetia bacterium]|nr:hypothetical protein [Planctomycetia bacterium]
MNDFFSVARRFTSTGTSTESEPEPIPGARLTPFHTETIFISAEEAKLAGVFTFQQIHAEAT